MDPCQHTHEHLCSRIDWEHNTADDRYSASSRGLEFVLYAVDDPAHPWAIVGRYAGGDEWTLGMKYDTRHHALMQAEHWAIMLGEGGDEMREDALSRLVD